MAELRPDSVGPEVLGNLRIHWATELPEGLNSVLLSDLQNDAWARDHVLYHADELGDHSLVHLEELLGRWLIEGEHLHGGDLESLLKDHVDNLSSEAIVDNMRLDDAAGAVVEGSRWSKRLAEELPAFLLVVSLGGTAMDGVSHGVRAESSSETPWSSFLGILSVSWADKIAETTNGALSYQLHTRDHIALHVGREIGEKWLASMLIVKLVSLLRLAKSAHLQLGNGETVLINSINNFACLCVTVRLDHSESSGGSALKLVLCEEISVVDQLKLPREHSDNGSKV